MKLHPTKSSRGVALVITLALVVLLAFVLVALFTRATSTLAVEKTSASGVEAQLLARSAAELVVSDLRAEMKEFSTANGTAWFPLSSTNMLPTRQLLTGVSTNPADGATYTNFINLIKQSGTPMFAGSPLISVSGATPTSTASQDGRSVTAARWSTPQLTGQLLPNTPGWIYVNRDATLSAAPSSATIGRFAFNVYDIGGLLDVNAAGFAPKPSGNDPDEMPTKGGLIWADLRSIPGINASAYAASPSWPPQWRVTGNWETFTSTNSASSLAWYHSAGWLQPYLNAGGADSDRMFASRQDLLRYARANTNTFSSTPNALQYLTTFSRALNQPNSEPPATRPKITYDENQGGNNAKGFDDDINPGARKADGTPLVKERFALDHIALLGDSTPDPARIKNLFGLEKSGNTWVYDHGDSSRILDLGAISGRDPDFFETLKAAITAGSLGVQHGTSLPVSPANFYRPSLGFDDSSLDYQILQIGANIIDQADQNSYPTVIAFDGQTFAGIENLPYIDLIATISLPEQILAGIAPPTGWTLSGNWTGPFQTVTLLMPRLWNPHSGNPGNQNQVPTAFRLRAETAVGGAAHSVQTRHNDNNANLGAVGVDPWNNSDPAAGGQGAIFAYRWDYTPLGGKNYGPGASDNPGTNLNGSEIGFTLAPGWQATFPNVLSDPRILSHPYSGSGFATITGTPGVTEFSTISPWIVNGFGNTATASAPAAPYDVFGFPLGRAWMGPRVQKPDPNDPANTIYKNLEIVLETWGGPIKIHLECEDGSGNWIPYDTAYYLPTGDLSEHFFGIAGVSNDMIPSLEAQAGRTNIRFDPRSKRWGLVEAEASFLARGSAAQANLYWRDRSMPERETLQPGNVTASPPLGVYYLPIPGYSFDSAASAVWSAPINQLAPRIAGIASVAVNDAGSTATYSYLDPDGIRRRGMAAYWQSGSFDGQLMADYKDPITGTTNPDVARNRAIILNRPFRSVAELGYVFRDTPWRNLDFFTVESGDSALLDFFCVHATEAASGRSQVPLTSEGVPVVAGKVNLNTRHPEVLAALIRGTAREYQNSPSVPISDTDALTLARGITAFTASTTAGEGPFTSLADLVGRPVSATAYAGFANKLNTLLTGPADRAKQHRETVLRALADAGDTRTWNVLIDVIAQSGIVPPGTTRFIPQGERRLWASTAIDRITTKVIDRQWETVNE